MAYNYGLSFCNISFGMKPSNTMKMNNSFSIKIRLRQKQQILCAQKKRCLRCNTLYEDKDNSPIVCSFHGHTTGKSNFLFFIIFLKFLLKRFECWMEVSIIIYV